MDKAGLPGKHMAQPNATLLIGLGSDHGDDAVGWEVVRAVEHAIGQNPAAYPNVATRTLRQPLDLLHHLTGIDRLLICDAYAGTDHDATVRRWHWPTSDLQNVPWRGTHTADLLGTLQLAATLQQLPPHVEIWGLRIDSALPGESLSADLQRRCQELAAELLSALTYFPLGPASSSMPSM